MGGIVMDIDKLSTQIGLAVLGVYAAVYAAIEIAEIIATTLF